NVISGNTTGVVIVSNATDSQVLNNRIGLNAAQTATLPNFNGVVLSGDNTSSIFSNLIVGNLGMGLYAVNGSHQDTIFNNTIGATFGNLVGFNRIGTDLTGSAAFNSATPGGVAVGMLVGAFNNSLVGNTIAGKAGPGTSATAAYVHLFGTGTAGNVLINNKIGV